MERYTFFGSPNHKKLFKSWKWIQYQSVINKSISVYFVITKSLSQFFNWEINQLSSHKYKFHFYALTQCMKKKIDWNSFFQKWTLRQVFLWLANGVNHVVPQFVKWQKISSNVKK